MASNQVGLAGVKDLVESILAENAAGGFIVASGSFTEDAWKFAEGRSVEMISSNYMLRLIMEILPRSSAIASGPNRVIRNGVWKASGTAKAPDVET